jgi:rubredoxin
VTKTYTCEQCGGVFDAGWTEEEARAEQRQNFGDMPDGVMAQVCDDCYKQIMIFVSDAGPEHG